MKIICTTVSHQRTNTPTCTFLCIKAVGGKLLTYQENSPLGDQILNSHDFTIRRNLMLITVGAERANRDSTVTPRLSANIDFNCAFS